MIKKQYSNASRRAMNMIWNAAGRYGFDPLFAAFHSNGQSDDYFNTVIGLTYKWLDPERIAAFFSSYGAHPKAEEFDEFLWLGLENCVYERELPERPALEHLRKRRGEEFFLIQQTLSEQQMALQSMPVYRQQQSRWAFVTGRKLPMLGPKETKMREALKFSGALDTDGVLSAMRGFLQEFFRYDPVTEPRTRREITGFRAWLRQLSSHEFRQRDVLIIRTGSGQGDPANAVALNWGARRTAPATPERLEEDRRYISALFGPCTLPETELSQAEALLCTGSDTGCRLWFPERGAGENSPGKNSPGTEPPRTSSAADREIADTLARMKKQKENNRRFLEEHRLMVSESVRKLSSELEVLLSSYSRGLPEAARSGKLVPGKAYRIGLLKDPNVFEREGEEREMHLRVELLLDASQSRMNSQERIASEAYIIARSLSSCHVPVRVTAFRSLRGFTVLERLKAAETENCGGILNYYTGGWNRDGLALKSMRYLIKEDQQHRDDLHLLLILTDASPNDTVAGSAFGKNYEGARAVDDAAAAVKALRGDGIRTAAIFHGSPSHLENVYRIYGKEYVRVFSLQQFAESVVDMLQKLLQETGA